jgi:hypothetical protein
MITGLFEFGAYMLGMAADDCLEALTTIMFGESRFLDKRAVKFVLPLAR